MNSKKYHVFEGLKKFCVLILMFAFVATACNEDDPKKSNEPGESNVILTGGPYTNLTAKTVTPALAGYNVQEDITTITYAAVVDGEDYQVVIAFPGKGMGQKAWDEENCFVQVMYEAAVEDEWVIATFVRPDESMHTGHVKIDSYGDVNGLITGSFEGGCTYLEASCENCYETGTMKGKFEAKRVY